MKCRWCKSERIAHVMAKCSDRCSVTYAGNERHDYVPAGVGIGGDDYIEFHWCLDCGRLQGDFPVSEEHMKAVIDEGRS